MHIIQLPLHQGCLAPQQIARNHGNCMLKITLRQLWQSHLKKTSGQVVWLQWTELHTSAGNRLLAFTLHTTPDLEKRLPSAVLYHPSQENIQNNNVLIIGSGTTEEDRLHSLLYEHAYLKTIISLLFWGYRFSNACMVTESVLLTQLNL